MARVHLIPTALAIAGCGRIAFTDRTIDAGDDAVSSACAPGQVTVKVATDADDGEIAAGISGQRWFPSGEPQDGGRTFIGQWSGAPVWGYFRFELPASFPQQPRFDAATLELTAGSVGGGAGDVWNPMSYAVRVEIEDSTTALVVSSESEFPGGPAARTLSTANARWPTSGGLAWPTSAGSKMVTPDLSTLITSVFDGNPTTPRTSLQLWLRGIDLPPVANTEVSYGDHSNAPLPDVARLSLRWSCPAP